jgi:hypothetical protein
MYSLLHTLFSGETSAHGTQWRPRDSKAAEWRYLYAELERAERARKAEIAAARERPRRWAQWRPAWPFSGSR